ncbi:hypothetical protein EVAR_17542_1 [Eumeta japonica]|uniref:Uncharacterized protein n=1 Tax=Eumeta variegata TaxID=151549 RepID=A0A4C1WPP1_EUMVA|nr:hypothetical protein EVAR_17542_1 [Eumeta japonica]
MGHIYNLQALEVPDHLIHITYSYISNRHFAFRHENTYYTKRLIRARILQGSTFFSPSVLRVWKRHTAPDDRRLTRVIHRRYYAVLSCKDQKTNSLHSQTTIDELGLWFRTWRLTTRSQQLFNLELPCPLVRSESNSS